jgi:hypothetical protein
MKLEKYCGRKVEDSSVTNPIIRPIIPPQNGK